MIYNLLNGQCHEIFDFWFFSWISFPQAPEYTITANLNFSNIRGYIHSSRCTTGGNDTGDKWKKSSIRKILIILFGQLWVEELTYLSILPSSSHYGVWSLILFPYFATGVVDTGGAPWLANISENFRKNSKRFWWDTLGLGESWPMKKTRSKNLVTLSL
jgi:hypothetical protein